ncbi:MAG: ATP synthase F1 subunit delta [Muribaculaceae bacterium]
MNDGLIPNRYAKALYKHASEVGEAGEVYGQMKRLAASFASVDGLKATINNPFIDIEDKEKVLLKAAGAQKDGSLDKFIILANKHSRITMLHAMALAYVKIYRSEQRISQVEIVTACPLANDKIKQITATVEKYLDGRSLETSTRIDESLIGGFVVKVDSVVLDASVKNELKKLRLKLLS